MKKAPARQHRRNPLRILQVFHNLTRYDVSQNEAPIRAELTRWHSPLASTTGFLADGVFFASEDLREPLLAANAADTLLLNDYNNQPSREMRIPGRKRVADGFDILSLAGAPRAFEIFTLRWSASGFELWLDYSKNAAHIGRPHRDDFKIANLEPGRAVRATINGKFDFSLTGRRPRTYAERDYLFLHQGEASCFEFLPAAGAACRKSVPLAEAKHVDLRVILY